MESGTKVTSEMTRDTDMVSSTGKMDESTTGNGSSVNKTVVGCSNMLMVLKWSGNGAKARGFDGSQMDLARRTE